MPAHRSQGVVDPRWDDRVDLTADEAVALQAAQSHGEHPLADPVDRPEQFREPTRPVAQPGDDEDGPLVADAVEHVAGEARLVRPLAVSRRLEGEDPLGGLHAGYLDVPEGAEGAPLRHFPLCPMMRSGTRGN